MPLISTLDILAKCEDGKYAVGAFNINSLDQPQAIIKCAAKLRSPVLVVEPGVIEPYVDFEDFAQVVKRAARDTGVPVGIHLSHGLDLEQFERACRAGFTSVMYDGSKLPYGENVEKTKMAVEMGCKYGCAVEGELGALGSSFANVAESMTDPALAKDFVKKTGVNILAVSIGNAHGFYKGTPSLDFKRLEEIRNALAPLNCYLTLHGGTGIPEEHIKRSIEMGIVKICIYTEMCSAGKNRAKAYIGEHPEYSGNFDVPDLIASIISGMTESEETCIKMFMSGDRVSESDVYRPFRAAAAKEPVVNTDPGPRYPSIIAENSAVRNVSKYWDNNV